jgi:hypothetical protein
MRTILIFLLLVSWVVPLQPEEVGRVATTKIDESSQRTWEQKSVQATKLSSDSEFLRRIYLDLTGRIPTIDQAREFLNSTDSAKRHRLITQLVNSQECAEYFASLWTTLFLGHKKERFVDPQQFESWLQEEFQQNKGWHQIARSLITAEGRLSETPELNWYAKQKLDASNLADDTSRIFLGIQLGCARCHNHPHDQWKLEDFYGMAAFYTGLRRDRLTGAERLEYRKLKENHKEVKEEIRAIKEKGIPATLRMKEGIREQMKQDRKTLRGLLGMTQGESLTVTAEVQGEKKTYPVKFLMQPEPAHIKGMQREELADWITSPENPFFARAFVNRIWGSLMGRGFVEPVDDMSHSNTPSNPELLDFLAEDFKQHNYDIKYLLVTIANSRIYQLSSSSERAEPAQFYERAKVKMMNADQLFNSMLIATSAEKAFRLQHNRKDFEEKREAVYRYYVFLFENDESKANEDIFSGTIPQALFLLNGKMTNDVVRTSAGTATSRILRDYELPGERLETIYLATLSRKPSPSEIEAGLTYVKSKQDLPGAYEDLFWALFNSNEFLFNH